MDLNAGQLRHAINVSGLGISTTLATTSWGLIVGKVISLISLWSKFIQVVRILLFTVIYFCCEISTTLVFIFSLSLGPSAKTSKAKLNKDPKLHTQS